MEESRRVYESLEKGSIKQEPTANSSIDRVGQIVGMKTEQVTPSSSQKPFNNVKIEPMDGVKDDVNYDDDMDDFNDEEVMDINKLGY